MASLECKLWCTIEALEEIRPHSCTGDMLRELIDVTEDYQRMKVEFNDLYEQDKHRVHKERADLLRENQLYNARYINSQL